MILSLTGTDLAQLGTILMPKLYHNSPNNYIVYLHLKLLVIKVSRLL